MKVNASNFKLNKSACPHRYRGDSMDDSCMYCGDPVYLSPAEEWQQLKRTRVENPQTSASSEKDKKETNYRPPRTVQNGRVKPYEQPNK